MKKFIAIMLAVVMFGTFIAGCGSTATGTDTQPAAAPAAATEPSTQPQKIKIVTTIFPEYDWVREVLGDKAEIVSSASSSAAISKVGVSDSPVTPTFNLELYFTNIGRISFIGKFFPVQSSKQRAPCHSSISIPLMARQPCASACSRSLVFGGE